MYSGYVQNTLINFKVIVQNANVILDCNIIWTLLTAQNNHDSTPQFFSAAVCKINQSIIKSTPYNSIVYRTPKLNKSPGQ